MTAAAVKYSVCVCKVFPLKWQRISFSGSLPTLQEWDGCNNGEEVVIVSFLWESQK